MTSLELAYAEGVKRALFEKRAMLAPILGAVAAPQGEGWRGAGGAALGTSLGSIAGGLGGGLLGAGVGSLAGGAPGAALGSLVGGGLGAVGGGIYGGVKGYRASVLTPEERAVLIKAKLRAAEEAED